MLQEPRMALQSEVPVLDMSLTNEPGGEVALAKDLRAACLTLGFFYVANHGVPQSLSDGMFDAMRRYFELPEAERRKDLIDDRFRRGFMPQGVNHTPGYKPDLKESYEIGLDLPLDDSDVKLGRMLHGPNHWPADYPWLPQVAEPYFDATTNLGRHLLRVFALSLDLDREFFDRFSAKPMMHMRLLHYPPQPAMPEDDEFGVPPHTDHGMLTILNQDPIGGLEIQRRDGEWIAAPFIPGTLVVNVGDLFKRWTNDLYVSTPHRVINRTGRERYSVPTFFALDYDTMVECLPGCASNGGAKYPPITSGDYLTNCLTRVHRKVA